jgi:hypothetical protein
MQLRRNLIEAQALQAIEAVLAGGRVEDDRIECKANWPEEHRVRQLAAHANTASGEPIIWLIGVDEKEHKVTQPGKMDPADWWARMSKRFDQVVPDMLDVTVHIGEGRTVTALAFTTDQAPYVITTGSEQGRVDREVPIRVATRTRSAHRHELLRLLLPAITLPRASPIRAWIAVDAKEQEALLRLSMSVFLEHSGGVTTMLPAHRMQARLDFDTQHFPSNLPPIRIRMEPLLSGPIAHGVEAGTDGVRITDSGVLSVWGNTNIDPDWLDLLSQVPAVSARCSFAVAGTNRPLELGATLHRTTPAIARSSPSWEFVEPAGDPWAADSDGLG